MFSFSVWFLVRLISILAANKFSSSKCKCVCVRRRLCVLYKHQCAWDSISLTFEAYHMILLVRIFFFYLFLFMSLCIFCCVSVFSLLVSICLHSIDNIYTHTNTKYLKYYDRVQIECRMILKSAFAIYCVPQGTSKMYFRRW